jgi:hypothetical protein
MPRSPVWIFVLGFGLLLLAAGLVWKATLMASYGGRAASVAVVTGMPAPMTGTLPAVPDSARDTFTGPITHRAPTNGYARDSLDVPEPPDYEDKVQNGPGDGGELGAGESRTHSLPLEGSRDVLVYAAHYDGTLELELTSPSGHVYGPGHPASPHVLYHESNDGLFGMVPGHATYFALDKAEAGTWKARVTAKSVPTGMSKVPYLLGTLIVQGGLAGIHVKNLTNDDRTYHLGESAVLVTSIFDGTEPVRDAQVVGYVPIDAKHPTAVPMLDDGHAPDSLAGDGKYTGRTPKLTRADDVFYSIRAKREAAAGKTGFDHTVGGMFGVGKSESHWTGRFRDEGRDTTGDGQFDELIVYAELDVTDPCLLSGEAILTDFRAAQTTGRLSSGFR